jgi:protein-disulfide isomerase
MSTTLRPPVNERDHIAGPADAPITMVEFGDYECPICRQAETVIRALRRHLGDRMRFAFRNFPIVPAHPHAMLAAEAAEAAGAQGKFWPMHDLLFDHQDALEAPNLVEYAGLIGLDVEVFVDDLRNHRHLDHIRDDLQSGVDSGVTGTPTFFVNSRRHEGGYDVDSLLAAMRAAIGDERGAEEPR